MGGSRRVRVGWEGVGQAEGERQGGLRQQPSVQTAVRGAETAEAHPCLSAVLTISVPSALPFSPEDSASWAPPAYPAPRKGGVRVQHEEKAEDKEGPTTGGRRVEAPFSYSHSLGIWMSRQGLQKRRGHTYCSATTIFPAALEAWLTLRPEGRGLVGSLRRELRVEALGEGRRKGQGGEGESRTMDER